jgi:hypothetical protein
MPHMPRMGGVTWEFGVSGTDHCWNSPHKQGHEGLPLLTGCDRSEPTFVTSWCVQMVLGLDRHLDIVPATPEPRPLVAIERLLEVIAAQKLPSAGLGHQKVGEWLE